MAESTFYETAPKPREATAITYEAEQREIDAPSQTVAGQMSGLLEKDSPWLTAARTRGKQYAAERGMLNTSIGGEATEKAAIESSLPIATSDAAAYLRQQEVNQAAVNRAKSEGAAAGQQAELFNVDFLNQGYFREQDVANRLKVDAAAAKAQAQLNAQNNAAALQQVKAQVSGSISVARLKNSGALDQLKLSHLSDMELQKLSDAGQLERTALQAASDIERQDKADAAAFERLGVSEAGAAERLGISEAGAEGRSEREIENRNYIDELDRDLQTQLSANEVSQADRTSFSNYVKDTSQQYNIQQTKISLDPELSGNEKNRALSDLKNSYEGNMQTMADLYSVDISWTEEEEEEEDTTGQSLTPYMPPGVYTPPPGFLPSDGPAIPGM